MPSAVDSYASILFDEAARWGGNDEKTFDDASDSSFARLFISSANGKNNEFFRLRNRIKHQSRIHWSLLHDKEWYKQQLEERSAWDIASNLDIDYAASIRNRLCISYDFNKHVGQYKCIPDWRLELNCDFGINMSWTISQTYKRHRYTIDEIFQKNTTTHKCIDIFIEKYKAHPTKQIILYGDSSGKSGDHRSNYNDYEIIEMALEQAGWEVQNNVARGNPPQSKRREIINKRLVDWGDKDEQGNGFVHELIDESCLNLIESIEMCEFDPNRGILKNKNVDHFVDAWSYALCYNYFDELEI